MYKSFNLTFIKDEQTVILVGLMKTTLKFIANKYLICATLLALHISFTEETNLFELIKIKSTLSESKSANDKMRIEIDETTQANLELTTNMAAKEKYARENYHMKKANEDIFVFVEK
ncbi:MAG: cell division protein DivIC [Parvicellaceae bacterium]